MTERIFLETAYKELGYQDGIPLEATQVPTSETQELWLDKGNWLSLAAKIGADKVFFVRNEPVIVFRTLDNSNNLDAIHEAFRSAWCMSRPTLLFLAFPDELQVYRLNQLPLYTHTESQKQFLTPLEIVQNIADVAETLAKYRREYIETGTIFSYEYLKSFEDRADKQLIKDLRTVRDTLCTMGLEQKLAHALIGRSIFIRYLEDRGVLDEHYYWGIAEGNAEWQRLLTDELDRPELSTKGNNSRLYIRVLRNKDFTYRLFEQLKADFNGDMFPQSSYERQAVQPEHLEQLHYLLLDSSDKSQQPLFFWAYDFEIVPTELISNIYEDFFHTTAQNTDGGTHYTPSVLVDYALSDVLTKECLDKHPVILDPACGSGIFLVEAFHRLVRHQTEKQGRVPDVQNLFQLMHHQIRGIEIDEDAMNITAFSLYLALLNYLSSPTIRQQRLPHLICRADTSADVNQYDILFPGDAFFLTKEEQHELANRLKEQRRFAGRAKVKKLCDNAQLLPIAAHSIDVIIGNPPWGTKHGFSQQTKQSRQQMLDWCIAFGWELGDKDPAQAFIARSLRLLRKNADAGLLVSASVLRKGYSFQSRWLTECSIKTVTSFAHLRGVHFTSDSPFVFIHYRASVPSFQHSIKYWSVKKTGFARSIGTVILSSEDIKRFEQLRLLDNPYLWKLYWWGNEYDDSLISALRLERTLGEIADERDWSYGRGFEGPSKNYKNNPIEWLIDYKELKSSDFCRYKPTENLDLQKITLEEVLRHGNPKIYAGWRVLIKRGIVRDIKHPGRIEARLENASYAVRNAVHGINVDTAQEWERKVIIGILWSKLAQYYLFLTSGDWGIGRHEIYLKNILSLPIRLPRSLEESQAIIKVVDALLLEGQKTTDPFLRDSTASETLQKLEYELDEAVFDLYELIEPERDQIREMCDLGLDFLYRANKSKAVQPIESVPLQSHGTIRDLSHRNEQQGLEPYLYALLEIWNSELEPDGEFAWSVLRPTNAVLIAVVLSTRYKGSTDTIVRDETYADWDYYSTAMQQGIGLSRYKAYLHWGISSSSN